jgi:S-adenosylmethionine/arginine decarboxylase-like enzyme
MLTFWGRWCGIDLRGCDLSLISDRDAIVRYVSELCRRLDFTPYGEPTIVQFGKRPEIGGYSMTQLIETSLVSGHFVDATRSAFIDIFSCAVYSPDTAVEFTRSFFRAAQSIHHVVDRLGDWPSPTE